MKFYRLRTLVVALGAATMAAMAAPATAFEWQVVVNNGDFIPTDLCDPTVPNPTTPPCSKFNSYNQPSVSANQVVVIRARSRGGQGMGQPVHGVFTRDMATASRVVKILDRNTAVPQPNNTHYPPSNPLLTMFTEPPSFPRIDIWSDTVATRGNHQPVWTYTLNDGSDTRAGTTGVYTNPFGALITGASKLGPVPEFYFFEVPEAPGTPFDVFPGAPAVTDSATIVFKGNYTVGASKTGVYYRDLVNSPIPLDGTSLAPAGSTNPIVLIANNTNTLIPGTSTVFGSTAPPSAADRQAVFAGFDIEAAPTLGGIYLAPLTPYPLDEQPDLTTLVSIGGQVPGESRRATFNRLGEGVSFDGRFVAFWGAWGTETKTLILQCPTEGNAARNIFCNGQYPDGFAVQVPVHQGIFVHDIRYGITSVVAKSPKDFDDFVYWNFSGSVPGSGEGDGEPARWRSASFLAVSGLVDSSLTDATFHVALKARTGDVVEGAYENPVDGIYLRQGPGQAKILTLVETGMDGTLIDPEAVYIDEETGESVVLPVTEMGLERDGFRGNSLAINVSMGTEESGWAGVYLTQVLK
ncbi:MAG: hypothetical protein M0Z71_10790 [Nitrospiraceae bacterium]|nr:hypothetical protein [Nitrospiraceae bacterium]